VLALHHASVRVPESEELGGIVNEGVRISRIVEFARKQDIPAGQHALLAGLVLSKRVVVSGPEDAAPAPPDEPAAPAAAVVAPVAPSSVTVQIPLEVTISLGTPTSAPAVTAVVTEPGADGAATSEAISIDPNYDDRRGYDPSFLGTGARRVPLPTLPPELLKKAARMKGVTGSSAHILRYHHYSVVINRERKLAFFTAVNIDGRQIVRIKRETDKWFLDPRIDPSDQAGEEIYADNDLDRGHLVRRLDPAWASTPAQAKIYNDDTFHFTNCTPQHKQFNESKAMWAGLEDYLLDNAENRDFKIDVFTGPVCAADDHPYRGIQLPRQFWKVAVMVLPSGKLSATGYVLSQEKLIKGLETLETLEDFSFGAYKTFQVPISHIEDLTQLSFGSLKAVDPLDGLEALELREISRREDLVLSG
jgi:endonuclease G, mitochondrial